MFLIRKMSVALQSLDPRPASNQHFVLSIPFQNKDVLPHQSHERTSTQWVWCFAVFSYAFIRFSYVLHTCLFFIQHQNLNVHWTLTESISEGHADRESGIEATQQALRVSKDGPGYDFIACITKKNTRKRKNSRPEKQQYRKRVNDVYKFTWIYTNLPMKMYQIFAWMSSTSVVGPASGP